MTRLTNALTLVVLGFSLQGCELAFMAICAGGIVAQPVQRVFVDDFTLSTYEMPAATVGESFRVDIDLKPFARSVTVSDGALPPGVGLEFDADALHSTHFTVTGVPTESGTYRATFRIVGNVTMCSVNRTERELEFVVNPSPTRP